jgi:surface protein
MNQMFLGITLPTTQYDDLLVNYEAQLVLDNVIFDGGNSKYSVGAATTARQALIDDHTWTITDGGQAFGFVSTWDTTQAGSASDTIILPMTAGSLVDWGDGTIDNLNTHTYTVGGVKTVKIDGAVTGFRFNNGGDKAKILTVSNSGGLVIDNSSMFYDCSKMTSCNLSGASISTTNLSTMFRGCVLLEAMDSTGWDTSSVTTIATMFFGCSSFSSLDLSGWDTSAIFNIQNTFFNLGVIGSLDLSGWDTSSVTNMSGMFRGASGTIVNVENFNVTLVTTMNQMFLGITLPTTQYDDLLVNYEAQLVLDNVLFDGGNSKYSAGAAATARQALIDDHTWTITDGGQV